MKPREVLSDPVKNKIHEDTIDSMEREFNKHWRILMDIGIEPIDAKYRLIDAVTSLAKPKGN